MALTPRLVPWASWAEWEEVREGLFEGASSDWDRVQSAIHRVAAWRARGRVPVAVEITASLREIHLADPFYLVAVGVAADGLPPKSTTSSLMLRQGYAAVIMRFIAGICDRVKTNRRQSVVDLAVTLGIPRLLVDVRHDTAHSEVPHLPLLRIASTQMLEWLQSSYWDAQRAALASAQATLARCVSDFMAHVNLAGGDGAGRRRRVKVSAGAASELSARAPFCLHDTAGLLAAHLVNGDTDSTANALSLDLLSVPFRRVEFLSEALCSHLLDIICETDLPYRPLPATHHDFLPSLSRPPSPSLSFPFHDFLPRAELEGGEFTPAQLFDDRLQKGAHLQPVMVGTPAVGWLQAGAPRHPDREVAELLTSDPDASETAKHALSWLKWALRQLLGAKPTAGVPAMTDFLLVTRCEVLGQLQERAVKAVPRVGWVAADAALCLFGAVQKCARVLRKRMKKDGPYSEAQKKRVLWERMKKDGLTPPFLSGQGTPPLCVVGRPEETEAYADASQDNGEIACKGVEAERVGRALGGRAPGAMSPSAKLLKKEELRRLIDLGLILFENRQELARAGKSTKSLEKGEGARKMAEASGRGDERLGGSQRQEPGHMEGANERGVRKPDKVGGGGDGEGEGGGGERERPKKRWRLAGDWQPCAVGMVPKRGSLLGVLPLLTIGNAKGMGMVQLSDGSLRRFEMDGNGVVEPRLAQHSTACTVAQNCGERFGDEGEDDVDMENVDESGPDELGCGEQEECIEALNDIAGEADQRGQDGAVGLGSPTAGRNGPAHLSEDAGEDLLPPPPVGTQTADLGIAGKRYPVPLGVQKAIDLL